MRLSIIMITVPERAESFNRLKEEVTRQIKYCGIHHPTLGRVEIVEVNTPKFKDGGGSIGVKRQKGLELSKGEYVTWLDDDDWISPDYVESLLRLAYQGADICTFNQMVKLENYWMVVNMHFKNKFDDEGKPSVNIKRRPYHTCVFRRGVTDGCTFPDANWDEDTGFIKQVLPNIKTWAHSDAILHEYKREIKSLAYEAIK